FDGRLVKMTGDGMLASFEGPSRAVLCARALHGIATTLGFPIRAGVHTGEVEVRGTDLGGIGVHIAARVAALADAGEVLATRTVRELTAGSGLEFAERGRHELKGVPDEWDLFALVD
ncbi:MAG TPA: adenylate/guanylate cyclase domain-containing protein, partial [Acidimicrobiia bacterium]|nr:adenylate/guanylate cyclase domain-containing protein [Acidimicrobiia bacterium]